MNLHKCGGINEDNKTYTTVIDIDSVNVGEYYIVLANTWNSDEEEILEASMPNTIIPLGETYDANVQSDLVSTYKNAYAK